MKATWFCMALGIDRHPTPWPEPNTLLEAAHNWVQTAQVNSSFLPTREFGGEGGLGKPGSSTLFSPTQLAEGTSTKRHARAPKGDSSTWVGGLGLLLLHLGSMEAVHLDALV